uniref:Tenascin-R n=1 Tax=Ciona savignyi TaxID=51511 RepID=H2YMB5_CIOSA
CPRDCSEHGRCIDGLCQCHRGYGGEDCAKADCPNACSGHGSCNKHGRCQCWGQWSGEDCSTRSCPNECNGKGICDNGNCICDITYSGSDCGRRSCVNDCNGHGRCEEESGRCRCNGNWEGDDCSVRRCPRDCSGHGECINGRCRCDEQWAGKACRVLRCLNGCSSNGKCRNGTCECSQEWTGPDCSAPQCPSGCSGLGQCKNGACECFEGWGGLDCGQPICPDDCSSNGQCVDGRCRCWGGWDGISCSEVVQPSGLQISNIQPTTIDVSWTKASSAVTANQVNCIPMEGTANAVYQTVGPNVTKLTIRDLDSGTQYSVFVYAMIGEALSAPITASVKTGVDTPSQLNYLRIGDTFAEITWTPPQAKVDRYKMVCTFLLKKSRSRIQNPTSTVLPNKTSVLIKDLSPGETYTVALYAVQGENTSAPIHINFTTSLDAPASVEFVDVTSSSATVRWAASVAKITGYQFSLVEFGGLEVVQDQVCGDVAANRHSFTFTQLKSRTRYNFTIYSVRDGTRSLPLNANLITGIDKPTHLRVQAVTPTSVIVTWNATQANVEGYSLECIDVRRKHVEEIKASSDELSTEFTNLRPATEYNITVQAELEGKSSSKLWKLTFTTLPPPAHVKVSSPTFDDLVVIWQPVYVFEERRIMGFYDIKIQPISPHTPELNGRLLEFTIPGDNTALSVPGMTAGLTYNITIVAKTKRNFLPPSPAVRVSYVSPVDPPQGATLTHVGHSNVTLRWFPPSAPITGYRVEYQDLYHNTRRQSFRIPPNETYVSINGLTDDTSYVINITSLMHGRSSVACVISTKNIIAVIEPPEYLHTTEITYNRIALEWMESLSDKIDGYYVTYIPLNVDGAHENVTHVGGWMDTVLEGLEPGTEYLISVFTIYNERGSIPVQLSIKTAIDPPSRLMFVTVSDSAFTIHWQKPVAMVSNYIVTYYRSSAGTERQDLIIPGGQTVCSIHNLVPATEYTVEIYAMGNSSQSDQVAAMVVTCKYDMIPSVRGVNAMPIDESTISVHWKSPLNVDVDSYSVQYRPLDEFSESREVVVNGDTTSTVMTGLLTDTQYAVTVSPMLGELQAKTRHIKATTGKRLQILQNCNFLSFSVYPFKYVKVQEVSETWVTLGWASQAIDSVEEYHVTYSLLNGTNGETRLLSGRSYIIQIRSFRWGQDSPDATSITVTTLFPLLPPRKLILDRRNQTGARITWTPNTPDADGHNITLSRVRQSRMQFSIRLSSKSRVVAFNDLLPGTRYRVTIATMRGNTTSKPQVLKFKTDYIIPSPTQIRFTSVNKTRLTTRWHKASERAQYYRIAYQDEDGTQRTVTISSRSTQLPLEHLKAGTTYNISVTALGRSKESFPLVGSVTTLLNPPSNLNVTTKSSKSVELTWKSLLNDVDGYVIKYHELESRSRRPNMIMRRNMKVIHMQSNTTKYVFQVVARKDGRESYSMRKIVETEIAPPQHVKTSVVSRRSANLTWEFADMTGVTGYLINITAINSTFYREYKVSATKRFVFFQNLFPGHEYDVDVATLRKLQKSSSVQVHFKTAKVPYLQPKDCVQVSLNGEKSDDVYEIFPYNGIKLKVFCDLTTDGGGWIVFQRRRDGSVSFDRSWEDYTTGFGNLTSEFWIGLQTLHELTTAMDAPQSLRIDLHHGDDKSYAAYHNFSISNSDDRFVLSASNYSGTAGDSLSYHYGMKFTTYDSDNDEATRNCAKEYKGAWWFKNCHRSTFILQGVNWYTWGGFTRSIDFVEMKIRPRSFQLPTVRPAIV